MGESDSVSPHEAIEGTVMAWIVIASLAVLVVSLAVVVYEAASETRR